MMYVSSGERYFLYARKSTDREDMQVRSIDDQLAELREFARNNNLKIADEIVEKQTAKFPGRPKFDVLVKRIESGEAIGILSWHPNRLSRNSVDTGYLIYLMDQNKLQEIRTPGQTFKNTPNDKFLLNLLCSQAKLENDTKAADVKRALQRKAKDGVFPGQAPVGYLNDSVTRKIVVDPHAAPMVRQMFERYATGICPFQQLKEIFDPKGLRSRRGAFLGLSDYQHILTNPFYYGPFRYAGEVYDGKHEPLIPKYLFDKVQAVMHDRGKPRISPRQRRLYQGMFRCGECGSCVTTETQKGHNYLRCTKKKRPCFQPYLREDLAVEQVTGILSQVAVPQYWIAQLQDHFRNRHVEEQFHTQEAREKLRATVNDCDQRLDRLTRVYIDRELTLEEYQRTKAKLIDEKAAAKDKLRDFENNPTGWLERADRFIARLNEAISIASSGTPDEQRDFLKEISSNLKISGGKIHYNFQPLWKYVATERRKGSVRRRQVAPTRRDSRDISHGVLPIARRSSASGWVAGFESCVKDTPQRTV